MEGVHVHASLGCEKWNFVIFDIGNKYQDIYTDLYQ